MIMPSSTLWGLPSSRASSMNAPGSPSSALQTTYLRSPSALRQASHLRPVGNPAPPRPRRPERLTSSRTASGPISRARASARVAAERDVVVDGRGVEQLAVAQQQAPLAAVEREFLLRAARRLRLGVGAEQPHHRVAEHRLLDDLGGVVHADVAVDDAVGVHAEQRAALAVPQAARGPDLEVRAALRHLGAERLDDLERALGSAAGAGAHGDDPALGVSRGDERLAAPRRARPGLRGSSLMTALMPAPPRRGPS